MCIRIPIFLSASSHVFSNVSPGRTVTVLVQSVLRGSIYLIWFSFLVQGLTFGVIQILFTPLPITLSYCIDSKDAHGKTSRFPHFFQQFAGPKFQWLCFCCQSPSILLRLLRFPQRSFVLFDTSPQRVVRSIRWKSNSFELLLRMFEYSSIRKKGKTLSAVVSKVLQCVHSHSNIPVCIFARVLKCQSG